jgi:hypothetical protein
MAEAQKSAILSLSKQEKLLLLELQKTRMSIVDELEQLDPQISADNWKDVQSTISHYQEKIIDLASQETMDGQKRGGNLTDLPGLSSSPTRGGRMTTGREGGGSPTAAGGQYMSVTTPARNKAVESAAFIPSSRFRTSVDMLPVFTSTASNELDRSLRRQADIRMPTFKLPDLDQERIDQILQESADEHAPPGTNLLKQQQQKMTNMAGDNTALAKSSQGKRGFRLRLKDAMGYTTAVFKALKKMGPMESSFVMAELGISHQEWTAVGEELAKRVALKVTVDTEEDPDLDRDGGDDGDNGGGGRNSPIKPRVSVFVAVKSSMMGAGNYGGGRGGTAYGVGEEPSVMSVDTAGAGQPFLGSKLDAASVASSLGGRGGGMGMGMGMMTSGMAGGGNMPRGSAQMSRSQPSLTKLTKLGGGGKSQQQHHRKMGGGGSRAGRSRADQSVADSIHTTESLRSELMESLRNMQHHTVGVKSSIAGVQSLAAVGNARAKSMLHAVAAEKMHDALSLVIKGELRRGWMAWMVVDGIRRRQQCTVQLTRMLGLRIIAESMDALVLKVLQKKMSKWIYYWRMESSRARREQQTEAAIVMQCEMRGYLARKRVRFIREQIKYVSCYTIVFPSFLVHNGLFVSLIHMLLSASLL